jgi:hypothetical protein
VIKTAPNPMEEGINERMKMLYAKEHCPQCALLPAEHDDEYCDMRYTKGEYNGKTSRIDSKAKEQL